jgi:hypothetical protein
LPNGYITGGIGSLIVDEELGYPHELILEAVNQSMPTIEAQYRYRVKLLASIAKQIITNKKSKLRLASLQIQP